MNKSRELKGFWSFCSFAHGMIAKKHEQVRVIPALAHPPSKEREAMSNNASSPRGCLCSPGRKERGETRTRGRKPEAVACKTKSAGVRESGWPVPWESGGRGVGVQG